MRQIHRFIQDNIGPADRMAEMVFGLIMALGVTGAIRLGAENLTNRELFVSVFGCNLAWGIVDGVVLVLMRLFDRGRVARIVRDARAAKDSARAYAIIERELAPDVVDEMTAEERVRLKDLTLGVLARLNPQPPRMLRGDLFHGIAAGLLVILPTLPVVAPYLIIPDAALAVRVSSAIALVLIFLVGARWAQLVGARPWRIGGALTLLGIILVAITISLGG
jgi:VIT family protein